MPKQKYKLTLEFDLNLSKGEVLDKHSLKAFKNQVYNFCYDWNGYFYAYFNCKNGGYDTNIIIPCNAKVKLKKRK